MNVMLCCMQVLSPESINVVHMHLEDIRDNITFDMVNLTGKAPEVCLSALLLLVLI